MDIYDVLYEIFNLEILIIAKGLWYIKQDLELNTYSNKILYKLEKQFLSMSNVIMVLYVNKLFCLCVLCQQNIAMIVVC